MEWMLPSGDVIAQSGRTATAVGAVLLQASCGSRRFKNCSILLSDI